MKQQGPIFADLLGTKLTQEDEEIIKHPWVSGIILFSRNYENKQQLKQLITSVRAIKPQIIICVDHEGGRVQRFREGFTVLPPMGELGELYLQDANKALRQAHKYGVIIGQELADVGIDFSFTPVLDIDFGRSEVIGNRAFSNKHEIISELAGALIDGLSQQDSASVGKHFPGHGYVQLDSHIADPVDERDFDTLWHDDIQPYLTLNNKLTAVMTAHIKYPQVDDELVTYSKKWLQDILREKVGYQGIIFSDDLSMHAAAHEPPQARVQKALDAGCDVVLLCNDPDAVRTVLNQTDKLVDRPRKSLLPLSSNYTARAAV
jgi:beta-N-acetylhexosaminidase